MDSMTEKKGWRLVYSCRLCRAKFRKGGIVKDKRTMLAHAIRIADGETVYPGDGAIGAARYDIHSCANGNIGIADFMGFEKEAE